MDIYNLYIFFYHFLLPFYEFGAVVIHELL